MIGTLLPVSMSHPATSNRFHLSTKAVESASLSLKSIDHIQGGDGLALGVFGVCDGVTDN